MDTEQGQPLESLELLEDDRKTCLLCGEAVHKGECYDESKDTVLHALIALKATCFLLLVAGTVMLVLSSEVAVAGGVWRFAMLASVTGLLPFAAGVCGLAADAIDGSQRAMLLSFFSLAVCGVVFHLSLAILFLSDPDGMRSALLSSHCPSGIVCGSDITTAEATYDDFEEVLIVACLVFVGLEVVAMVAACRLSVPSDNDQAMHEMVDTEVSQPPQLRYVAVAHMMLDDKVQLTASADLEQGTVPSSNGHKASAQDLSTVVNRVCIRCLDQGAQGLFGVLSQKLQIFSCEEISGRHQQSHSRYPQQFLVCWVDLTGDAERTVTVGGLSSSISRVCFSTCDSVGAKAMAFVVVYDKDFPRRTAAHFLFSALHEPAVCCAAGDCSPIQRDETLLAIGSSVTAVKKSRKCTREESQVVMASDRLRPQKIEEVLGRHMARTLAEQEHKAVKQWHEAAVKRHFNRSLDLKPDQGGMCQIS